MTEIVSAADDTVTLVNTGRAPYQVMQDPKDPHKYLTLLPNSANSLPVPKDLAEKIMRAYPSVKDSKSIFPDAPNIGALSKENADLRARAVTLEKLLGLSDAQKKALDEKVAELEKELAAGRADAKPAADVAALQATVADLQGRLKEFLDADTKKALDALQVKHADAVPADA